MRYDVSHYELDSVRWRRYWKESCLNLSLNLRCCEIGGRLRNSSGCRAVVSFVIPILELVSRSQGEPDGEPDWSYLKAKTIRGHGASSLSHKNQGYARKLRNKMEGCEKLNRRVKRYDDTRCPRKAHVFFVSYDLRPDAEQIHIDDL